MGKSDYILRIIEQISIIIAQIIGLKKENRLEESQLVLNDVLTQYFGLNSKLADVLTYHDLIHIISGREGLNTGKCIMLAELLKLKADLYELQGYSVNAYNLYLKSMNFFVEAILVDNHLCSEENIDKIDEIVTLISIYESTDEIKQLLFKYYELSGRYDKAEDLLYELLESTHYDLHVVDNGIAFYERLIARSESELLQGNLPIAEVLESYNELCNYKQ